MRRTRSVVIVWEGGFHTYDRVICLYHCDEDVPLASLCSDCELPPEEPTHLTLCTFLLHLVRVGPNLLPGYCSRPCRHGVVVMTPDFPFLVADMLRMGELL